jgi:hypothetical protein
MSFIIQHTCLGFCWLDLVALVILIGVIVFVIKKKRDIKKEAEELEEQLSAFYAEETVEAESITQS